jgi:hypothetical protein
LTSSSITVLPARNPMDFGGNGGSVYLYFAFCYDITYELFVFS